MSPRKLLSKIWRTCVLSIYNKTTLHINIAMYNLFYRGNIVNVRSKEKIKVVFFPINVGMWKNDYLFNYMLQHPRFEPYIVSFLVPSDNWSFQLRNQREMRSFFESKGYPYFDMYDEDKESWFDIRAFNPDVVFYTQAVNVSYPQYRIQSLWKRSIFYYVPYCMGMEKEERGYNTLLFNICTKVFAPSDYHKTYWSSFFYNKGENIVSCGYLSFDYLVSKQAPLCDYWKSATRKKRVIWAPHHSIGRQDLLSYSNFLEVADKMLELANKYQDSIDFVFKPHPRLRPKLEKMQEWGIEKTRDYYNKWETLPNTNYVDGDYFSLFKTSDAMIHDCSTFMAEYLLTGNPVMFNMRDATSMSLNEYAIKCLEQHYIGHTIEDIELFLNNVVLDKNDDMKEQRLSFVENVLKNGSNELVATKIFGEIKKDLL